MENDNTRTMKQEDWDNFQQELMAVMMKVDAYHVLSLSQRKALSLMGFALSVWDEAESDEQ